jgi:hypothetical protein
MGWIETLNSLVTDEEGQLSWEETKDTCEGIFKGLHKVAPYGFFTPFKSKTDFALTLVAPVVAPFALTVLAPIVTIGALVASVTCLSSLLVAGVAAACDKKETQNSALNLAVISGVTALGCFVFATLASLATTVASLIAASYLVTRTGASIVSSCNNNKNYYTIYADPDDRDIDYSF